MGLHNTTVNKISRRQPNPHLAAATAEEYFPHAEVPILDDDVDDGYFEPDGVNDFVRDAEAWNPDREF